MDRGTREVNLSRLQFHDEQQVERDKTALRPDFDRCEVDRGQHVPMALDECRPAR